MALPMERRILGGARRAALVANTAAAAAVAAEALNALTAEAAFAAFAAFATAALFDMHGLKQRRRQQATGHTAKKGVG
jgi:hypothetical protein